MVVINLRKINKMGNVFSRSFFIDSNFRIEITARLTILGFRNGLITC